MRAAEPSSGSHSSGFVGVEVAAGDLADSPSTVARTVSVMTTGHSCSPMRATARGEPGDGVVVVHHRAVPGRGRWRSAAASRCPSRRSGSGRARGLVVERDAEAADLADRLGAVGEQVGVVVDQVVRALPAAGLLVGRRTRARCRAAAACRCAPTRARARASSRPCPSCRSRRGPRRSRPGPRRRTGRRDHSSASAGTTSRWPWISSGARLLSVPSMRAIVDARPGSASMICDSMPTSSSLLGHPLGGRPLGVRRVGGVDADQVGEQVDDLVLDAVGLMVLSYQAATDRTAAQPCAATSRPDHVTHRRRARRPRGHRASRAHRATAARGCCGRPAAAERAAGSVDARRRLRAVVRLGRRWLRTRRRVMRGVRRVGAAGLWRRRRTGPARSARLADEAGARRQALRATGVAGRRWWRDGPACGRCRCLAVPACRSPCRRRLPCRCRFRTVVSGAVPWSCWP